MEKIIEKLKDGIAEAIIHQDNLDGASWGYQEGVLITANEAKAILEALKALKISSNPPVIKSVCRIHGNVELDSFGRCPRCNELLYVKNEQTVL